MAQSGHPDTLNQCPLLGVKRTWRGRGQLSAIHTLVDQCVASATQITVIRAGAFLRLYSERSAMSIRRPEIAPLAVSATTPQPKMRKPPPKVRAAIEALVTGQIRTIKAAVAKVGLTRERLSRAFSEPHIRHALRERVDREVALTSGRAAARLGQLLDSSSQRVALEATKFSLGVAGIKPVTDAAVVNIAIQAGYVIDLSEPGQPAPKIVGGQVIDATAEPIAGIGPSAKPAE
jgi:hypothetical protein